MPTCKAKIRPFPGNRELSCELPSEHLYSENNQMHISDLLDYAYPGSRTRVSWEDGDRRNFYGEFSPCPRTEGCILPAGHPRDCTL